MYGKMQESGPNAITPVISPYLVEPVSFLLLHPESPQGELSGVADGLMATTTS